jgi:hypothetical protein
VISAVALCAVVFITIMVNATPSTANLHFRKVPLTGHIADMPQTTRMTQSCRFSWIG